MPIWNTDSNSYNDQLQLRNTFCLHVLGVFSISPVAYWLSGFIYIGS